MYQIKFSYIPVKKDDFFVRCRSTYFLTKPRSQEIFCSRTKECDVPEEEEGRFPFIPRYLNLNKDIKGLS